MEGARCGWGSVRGDVPLVALLVVGGGFVGGARWTIVVRDGR